jgi:hypothetical protein
MNIFESLVLDNKGEVNIENSYRAGIPGVAGDNSFAKKRQVVYDLPILRTSYRG